MQTALAAEGTTRDESHRNRALQAIRFERPDRTPRDFAAVPEAWDALSRCFGVADRESVLRRLEVDCRIFSYDSFCRHPNVSLDAVDMAASQERSSTGGMWRLIEPDGSNRDIWGAHRRRVRNAFGELDEFASFPLGEADAEGLMRWRWPEPDWWDFADLRTAIEAINSRSRYLIRFRVGSVFETAWSLYGMERFLLDLASAPANPMYIMERLAEVHCENLRRALAVAGDLIDVVYFYDDLASQNGLLLSPAFYGRTFQPLHQRIVNIARAAGKTVMIHSCGAVAPLIETFIDMGIGILNPVQPLARNMDAERLAERFMGRIAFHGGIDVQHLLPRGTVDEVRAEARRVGRLLGANGGYIIAGSHHIQADAPIENVLAMYSA